MDAYLSQFYLWVGWQPYTWFTLFVAATIGDGLTTLYALNRGAYEANPVMRWAMKKTSPLIALAVIKMVQVVIVYSSLQPAILYMPVLALFFVSVCLWNIGQILKMRARS